MITRRGFLGFLLGAPLLARVGALAPAEPGSAFATVVRNTEAEVVAARSLRVESLEATLRVVTYRTADLKLWGDVSVGPPRGAVDEYEVFEGDVELLREAIRDGDV